MGKNEIDYSWVWFFLLLGGSLVGGTTAGIVAAINDHNKGQGIQLGYAKPSKLEIDLKDLDGDGKKETILKYENRQYLLKLDSERKLTIVEYKDSSDLD